MKVSISGNYSFREAREFTLTVTVDHPDDVDEDVIRKALEDQEGMTFSEDEEWACDDYEVEEA